MRHRAWIRRAVFVPSVGPRGVGVASRLPLALGTADGPHAYVEPKALMRADDDLVVVGSPTYTWERGGPMARMTSDGAHVAAYLDVDAPRLVELPMDVDAREVRAAALDDRARGVHEGESVRIVRTKPFPYTGFFAVTAGEPEGVVVTGPEFDPDPARPTVRSLTLRLNPSCQ